MPSFPAKSLNVTVAKFSFYSKSEKTSVKIIEISGKIVKKKKLVWNLIKKKKKR